MAPKRLPSFDYLQQCFSYDAKTGLLYWRQRPVHHFPNVRVAQSWNTRRVGSVAGFASKNGYRGVLINRTAFLLHRIIWTLVTGTPPPNEIDHIDGDPGNNRFHNLRLADRSQNTFNRCMQKNNTSGAIGVWRSGDRFRASIRFHRKRYHLGYFPTFEAAKRAYDESAAEFFGDFHRTYIK